MIKNLNLLFDRSKYVLCPTPTQHAFESEYMHLLKRLPYIMDMAFSRMMEERRAKSKISVNRNWCSNTMNGLLTELLAKEFPEYLRETGRNSHFLNVDNRVHMYYKKFDKWLRPMYNHTMKSQQLINNLVGISEKTIPVMYFGYTTNKDFTVITGYYVMCRIGAKVEWKRDLTDFLLPAQTKPASVNVQEVAEVRVKIKDKRKAL